MTKYLKIVSTSVTSPEDMFTLGVSTSRGKEEKIGQFGSGALLGTLAWIRTYGESPVFLVNGKRVTFSTRDIKKSDGETFKQVLMKVDRKSNPLTVALEYGTLDWPTPDLGLREWISNAIDTGANIRESMSIVSKIEADDSEVAVFVPYTDIAKAYYDDLPKYFLHAVGKEKDPIIDKDQISPCRIYRKGVFIRELLEESLFDYNLDFSINECRTGSSDSLKNDCNLRWQYYEDNVDRLKKIRKAILQRMEILETDTYWTSLSGKMYELWKELIGEVSLCSTSFVVPNCTPITAKWYDVIVGHIPELNGLSGFTEAAILGFDVQPPSESHAKIFNLICETIETIGLTDGLPRPSLEMYDTKDGSQPKMAGIYTRATKHVMVWKRCEELTSTMVHELCHHYTRGADDYSRRFNDYAHNIIAAIIEKLM
jgi:hypothetical protein